jgi:hypothetical protein
MYWGIIPFHSVHVIYVYKTLNNYKLKSVLLILEMETKIEQKQNNNDNDDKSKRNHTSSETSNVSVSCWFCEHLTSNSYQHVET